MDPPLLVAPVLAPGLVVEVPVVIVNVCRCRCAKRCEDGSSLLAYGKSGTIVGITVKLQLHLSQMNHCVSVLFCVVDVDPTDDPERQMFSCWCSRFGLAAMEKY